MQLPFVRPACSLLRQSTLVARLGRFTVAVALTTVSLVRLALASVFGLALGAGSAEASPVPGTLYGVSFQGVNAAFGTHLLTINPADGAILTDIGFAGFTPVADITLAPDGTLYGLNCCLAGNNAATGNVLFTINPVDGALLAQNPFSGGTYVSDIAIAPNGTLYGLNCCHIGTGGNAAAGDFLFTINPGTGQILTQIQFGYAGSLSSIAFAPDGTLYGVNYQGGNAGVGQRLLTINPTDGAILTDIGFGYAGSVSSIAFAPVPEPGTGLLLMTGLAALAYRERRYGRAAESDRACATRGAMRGLLAALRGWNGGLRRESERHAEDVSTR